MKATTKNMIVQLQKYFQTQPVEKAWLFGSFARGEETKDSDVDIIFAPQQNTTFSLLTYGGMYMDLRDILGREVDLVKDGTLLPFAAQTANKDKMLIYERKY